MDTLDRFAHEAARFVAWARSDIAGGPAGVREALERILALYMAGLALPNERHLDVSDVPAESDVSSEERERVLAACARLPVQYYGAIVDALELPPEESSVGDVADDIADIYVDVARGLAEYEAGRRAEAHWQWAFHFRIHWGAHATSAASALHAWLTAVP